jgi:uncharacterized protein YbaP (TraB family)
MKKVVISLVLSMLLATPALCETSLWVARAKSSVMYIGGTVHLLRESDFPFPPEFDRAYGASEVLVFETDFSRMNSLETQNALMAKAAYTDGRTLEDVLSAEAYAALEEYSAENEFPLGMMRYLRPSIVTMTLMVLELQKLGVDQEGVDSYYHGKATEDEKTIAWFETVDEQIEILVSMGEGNESEFVLYSLDEVDELREKFDELVTAWETGHENELYGLFVEELQEKFPKLYKSMLVDRNNNWMPMIEEYLATPETEFVLVGPVI